MKRKIFIIDVGTHKAQEFKALFGHSVVESIWRYVRRCAGSIIGRGDFVNFSEFRKILKQQALLKKNRSNFFYIFVEPNSLLFGLPIYKKSDLSLNIALSNDEKSLSLKPLYYANNDDQGQSSSLYLANSIVNKTHFKYVLNIDSIYFANEMKKIFDDMSEDYSVVLRINNEGSESEVIYAFHQVFGNRMKLVAGSLKDVGVVKGQDCLTELYDYMKMNDIKFSFFHSGIGSWSNTMSSLIGELK